MNTLIFTLIYSSVILMAAVLIWITSTVIFPFIGHKFGAYWNWYLIFRKEKCCSLWGCPECREFVWQRLIDKEINRKMPINTKCDNCFNCLNEPEKGAYSPVFNRMFLCPICGNKRCPKASNHINQCSGSNEPG